MQSFLYLSLHSKIQYFWLQMFVYAQNKDIFDLCVSSLRGEIEAYIPSEFGKENAVHLYFWIELEP